MTVYHGSNVEVKDPKILKPNRELDFASPLALSFIRFKGSEVYDA